jgi:predicted Rossmann-fold nucleotide-binding protein
MMRVVADAAQAAGGKIVGISVEPIKARARPNADEMIIARDWPERRATLLARGDVIAVLPGGLGTLDEITEVLEYKKNKTFTINQRYSSTLTDFMMVSKSNLNGWNVKGSYQTLSLSILFLRRLPKRR